MSMNFWGSFSLAMECFSMLELTESKAADMSRDRIHSSSFFSLEVLYIEFRI